MMQTSRLLLRPWQAADAPALLHLLDTNRARFTADFPQTLAAVHDIDSTAAFIAQKNRAWEQRTAFQLGVWQRENGQLSGFVSLKEMDWSVPKAELAYLLAASAEGQGLMTEALPALLRWVFAELRLERVYCRVKQNNIRSAQLAQRVGFQLEGTLRNDFRGGDGRLVTMQYWGLLRTDFPSSGEST